VLSAFLPFKVHLLETLPSSQLLPIKGIPLKTVNLCHKDFDEQEREEQKDQPLVLLAVTTTQHHIKEEKKFRHLLNIRAK
jgi:hypothetical protein